MGEYRVQQIVFDAQALGQGNRQLGTRRRRLADSCDATIVAVEVPGEHARARGPVGGTEASLTNHQGIAEPFTLISTVLAPSKEWAAFTVMRPERRGRVLIQIAPTPPLSTSEKGLSPTSTPGPVSSKATSPPANARSAPNLSTTLNASRVASAPSSSSSGSSASRKNRSWVASEENERDSARRSPT